jgi:hypothetical protein
LGDLDDVAVSSAGAAALEGAFSTHGGLGGVAGRSVKREIGQMLLLALVDEGRVVAEGLGDVANGLMVLRRRN